MGTAQTRRRNRNRRLRKKSQKQPNGDAFTISRNVFVLGVFIPVLTFLIGKTAIDNIRLFDKGVETKAYVYKLRSYKNGSSGVYEFKVLNERYTGEDSHSKVGDSIHVVYLPNNPKINRSAEVLDKDWGIWLYRRLFE